jgi:lipopolysaccharide export LptBFGC system permease protein LptF
MERLIDPSIADLRTEHAAASRGGNVWKSGRALIVGYIALGKVLLLCGVFGTRQAWTDWDGDDRQNLHRVFWCSGVITVAFAVLFELPELLRLPATAVVSPDARATLLVVYLIPAALATSIPIGLFAGIALGLRGRRLSRRLVGVVLLVAVVTSAGSFVNVAVVTPASNQWYREEIIQGSVPKGERELTLIELRRATEELQRWDAAYGIERRADTRRVKAAYQARFAIAATPLTFAILALVLAAGRRLGRLTAALVVCAGTVGLILLWMLGAFLSRLEAVPLPLGVWFLHIVIVLTSAGIMAWRTRVAPLTRTRA